MPPPSQEVELTGSFLMLSNEISKAQLAIEGLVAAIRGSQYNSLLLVGIMTSRFMLFKHVAQEYRDVCQLNSKTFNLDVTLLQQACQNINNSFWNQMDMFANNFCKKANNNKKDNLSVARSEFNKALQVVFHLLCAIQEILTSIKKEVYHNMAIPASEFATIKVKFLECIASMETAVTLGKEKYLTMPQAEQILALTTPPEASTSQSLSSLPSLVMT